MRQSIYQKLVSAVMSIVYSPLYETKFQLILIDIDFDLKIEI